MPVLLVGVEVAGLLGVGGSENERNAAGHKQMRRKQYREEQGYGLREMEEELPGRKKKRPLLASFPGSPHKGGPGNEASHCNTDTFGLESGM